MTTNFDKPVGTEIAELAGNIENLSNRFANYAPMGSFGAVTSTSPKTLSFSESTRFLLVGFASGEARSFIALCIGSASGSTSYAIEIQKGSSITIAGSTSGIAISSSSTSSTYLYAIVFTKNVSAITVS